MADWKKIKTEYITTNTSYRKLAEKYGISYQAICRRSQAEQWSEQREQHMNKTVTKTINRISEKQVDRAARLMTVADRLLEKLEQSVEIEGPISASSIKNLSDALRNIKETQMIRTEEDVEEQKARIAKLRKEAEKEETQNKDVTVVIEGGDPSWQS